MIRTLVAGVVLFLGFAVALAPASLVRTVVPDGGGVELLEPTGTVWDGAAELYLSGQPAGRLHWDVAPTSLMRGALGYDVTLTGPEHDLAGSISLGLGSGEATIRGQASAAFANRWLAPYDIDIGGRLDFRDAHVRLPYDLRAGASAAGAAGSLAWSGGPVRYVLSGQNNAGTLPPLVAYLGEGLETVVIPDGGQTPLLRAELLPNGFVRIAMTKLLTRLVDNPWPGSQADHEVVLEVEEQLFQ